MDARKEIRGYEQVRAAASNWQEYSSDLLGDRDVRDYRQLPLEVDPPRHTKLRFALQPIFSAAALKNRQTEFESLGQRIISELPNEFDAVKDLALPYVIGCLSIIYDRPQDFELWKSWGPDVWTAEAYQRGESLDAANEAHRKRDFSGGNPRSGALLQAYLDRVFDDAEKHIAAGLPDRDIWDTVARLEIDGVAVTRREMQGIANVLLAGGRDTVIKLLCGFVWHLVLNPKDIAFLESPENFRGAFQEMVRYLTPLPRMERVPREHATGRDEDRDPSKYVLLGFVSANFDERRFENPQTIDFTRERNAHVGFGFGPHVCLGQNIAEAETRAFLNALLPQIANWKFVSEPVLEWVTEHTEDGGEFEYLDKFNRLPIAK